MNMKSNEIMATATVALAISAAVQGIVAFQQFSKNISGRWTEIMAMGALGLMAIASVVLSFSSFVLLREVKSGRSNNKK